MATTQATIGEKTPEYMWADGTGGRVHLPDVHRNIHEALPDARLIFSLRNPVERAISAVNHCIRYGRVHPLQGVDELLLGRKQHLLHGYGVLEMGYYARFLEAYLELFDREQILILIFEEGIVQEPVLTLSQVCSSLGVDPSFQFTALSQRDNRYHTSTLRLLLDYYAPFLRPLTRRIDRYPPQRRPLRPSDHTLRALYRLHEQENERPYSLLGRRIPSWDMPSALR